MEYSKGISELKKVTTVKVFVSNTKFDYYVLILGNNNGYTV